MKKCLSVLVILFFTTLLSFAGTSDSFSNLIDNINIQSDSTDEMTGNLYISSDGSFLCFDFMSCSKSGEPLLGIGFFDAEGKHNIIYNRYTANKSEIYLESSEDKKGYETIKYSMNSGILRVHYKGIDFELIPFFPIECPFAGKRFFEGSIFDSAALDFIYTDKNSCQLIGIRNEKETDYKYYYLICSNEYLFVSSTKDVNPEKSIIYSYSYDEKTETLTLVNVGGSQIVFSAPVFINSPFDGKTYKQYVFLNGLILDFTEFDGTPVVGIKEGSMTGLQYYYYKCDKDHLYIGDINRVDECSVLGYSLSSSKKQLKLFYRDGSFVELDEEESKKEEIIKDGLTFLGALGGLGGAFLYLIGGR